MGNPTSTTKLEYLFSNISTTRSIITSKRQKLFHNELATADHHQSLLPGLPDHIAQICLSRVPPSILYSVCKSWRRIIYTPSFPPFLSLYSLFLTANSSISLCSFDPISCKWNSLNPDHPIRAILRHPSFISRKLPIQSVTVSGKLVIIAATADQFVPALTRPVVFDPLSSSNKWSYGPPLSTPRRWCAAGASRGAVYVASGIGAHYNNNVARSVEKWDLQNNNQRRLMHVHQWKKMRSLSDGKFSRDAIDAVGWRGKLCMVNVKGDAAKEGIIYDVDMDTWEKMPDGMLSGWRGPAAAMEEEVIYVVDESKGSLRRYDDVKDIWVDVLHKHEMLKGVHQIVAAAGKVCALCSDGIRFAIVDVATSRVFVVDAPAGFQAVGIHILPRMII